MPRDLVSRSSRRQFSIGPFGRNLRYAGGQVLSWFVMPPCGSCARTTGFDTDLRALIRLRFLEPRFGPGGRSRWGRLGKHWAIRQDQFSASSTFRFGDAQLHLVPFNRELLASYAKPIIAAP